MVLGQWLNQSFNALVNYTNRNAKSETTSKQIFTAYLGATGGAVAAAAGMNAMVKVKMRWSCVYCHFIWHCWLGRLLLMLS